MLISVFFNADWRLRRPVLHGVRAWCCHSGGTLASSQSMHSQPPVVLVHPRTQEWFVTDRVAACERGEEPRTSRSSMVMGAGESCQSFPPALMRSLPRPAGRRHRNVNGFRPCKSAVVVCLRRHVGEDTALTGHRLAPRALHRRCCGSKRAAEELDGTSRAYPMPDRQLQRSLSSCWIACRQTAWRLCGSRIRDPCTLTVRR